jgi:hypothetical protein
MKPRKMLASRGTILRKLLRRGSILTPTVLFGATVGMGVAALAVDTGLMFAAKQELRNAADAAALAAASQLGQPGATEASVAEAARIAALNQVAHEGADLLTADVILGHATMSGSQYVFHPHTMPYDAVKVTLRRDSSVSDGPISLVFAQGLGMQSTDLSASATAMIVPRDISVVIDLSGSMNDDSELRHYKDFDSESGNGTRPGVTVNLMPIWDALPVSKGRNGIKNGSNPSAPVQPPSGGNSQPGNGSGSPGYAGGNTGEGPRWGWMTKYGSNIVLGTYTPVGDSGLYYIPKSSTTTDSDVVANLTECGYSSTERSAMLSGSNDGSTTNYRSRVKVLLGLAGWKSGKSGGKYGTSGGNGDNKVDSGELTQTITYPFNGGSWDNYIDYMTNASEMRNTDGNWHYRFGIKTFTNYLLEKYNNHSDTPDLANCPEEPLHSVKVAVQALVDELIDMDSDDHVSLETFAQYGNHRVNLAWPSGGQTLAQVLQLVPDNLNGMQSGHFTSITNIGEGLNLGITELSSPRARDASAKVIVLMTDGKPNTDSHGNYVGNNANSALNWCRDRAEAAHNLGYTVYVIGVGGDVDADLCSDLASTPEHYYYADSSPDPDHGGQPMYISQLQQIFQTVGGQRPVKLIQ